MPPKRKSDALDNAPKESEPTKSGTTRTTKKARVSEAGDASGSSAAAVVDGKTGDKTEAAPKSWRDIVLDGEGEVRSNRLC